MSLFKLLPILILLTAETITADEAQTYSPLDMVKVMHTAYVCGRAAGQAQTLRVYGHEDLARETEKIVSALGCDDVRSAIGEK